MPTLWAFKSVQSSRRPVGGQLGHNMGELLINSEHGSLNPAFQLWLQVKGFTSGALHSHISQSTGGHAYLSGEPTSGCVLSLEPLPAGKGAAGGSL